jgi:CRISPR/Cas system-associated protein endoribonuclease Cas2
MEPWQAILFVVAAAALGYSLFQGAVYRRKLQKRDSLADALEDVREIETSAGGIVRQLEVRAYDYSREVEARIDNRLVVLDQLIIDADREIDRLRALLAESRFSQPADRELTREEQQRCFALEESGFSLEEIARCLNALPVNVQRALDEWRGPGRGAA